MNENFMEIVETKQMNKEKYISFAYEGKNYFAPLQNCIRLLPEYAHLSHLSCDADVKPSTTNMEEIIKWAEIVKYEVTNDRSVARIMNDFNISADAALEIQQYNAKQRLEKGLHITQENDTNMFFSLLDKMISNKKDILRLLLDKAIAFSMVKYNHPMFEKYSPSTIDLYNGEIRFYRLYVENRKIPGVWNYVKFLSAKKDNLVITDNKELDKMLIGYNHDYYDIVNNAIWDVENYGYEETLIKFC